jgi:hypothetical protein
LLVFEEEKFIERTLEVSVKREGVKPLDSQGGLKDSATAAPHVTSKTTSHGHL